jgi:hypothetical protein
VRAHERRVELRARDFARFVDLHVANHAQSFDFRVERADAVRQRLRQHRHDETGKYTDVARLYASASSGVPGCT